MVQSPATTVELFAQETRELIDAALLNYTDFGRGCPDQLRDAIRYSLLSPGKRLRPILVLMATDACRGDRRKALPAACAVEMVHAYSLIHDDLPAMDDDDLRRGRPTCHKAFGEAVAPRKFTTTGFPHWRAWRSTSTETSSRGRLPLISRAVPVSSAAARLSEPVQSTLGG